MKPEYHYNIIQGTEDWYHIRLGRVTGSMFSDLMVDGEQLEGFGKGAITSLLRICEERLTGLPRQSFSTRATDFGHENEHHAIHFYEEATFHSVEKVGFVSVGDWMGVSPDGLIGKEGGIELKCLPTQHMSVIYSGDCKDKAKHVNQCLFNILVTGRKWWDLVYYHPDFPGRLKMKIFRITLTDKMKKIISDKVELFIRLIKKHLKQIEAAS